MYTTKSTLAPGAIPHDGRGEPVLSAAEPATRPNPTVEAKSRDDLIFFDDLTYSPGARAQ